MYIEYINISIFLGDMPIRAQRSCSLIPKGDLQGKKCRNFYTSRLEICRVHRCVVALWRSVAALSEKKSVRHPQVSDFFCVSRNAKSFGCFRCFFVSWTAVSAVGGVGGRFTRVHFNVSTMNSSPFLAGVVVFYSFSLGISPRSWIGSQASIVHLSEDSDLISYLLGFICFFRHILCSE